MKQPIKTTEIGKVLQTSVEADKMKDSKVDTESLNAIAYGKNEYVSAKDDLVIWQMTI